MVKRILGSWKSQMTIQIVDGIMVEILVECCACAAWELS